MRVQFVPGREPPALLDLPWSSPVSAWSDERLVRMAHGISRHVVRFVRERDRVFALKEIDERSAAHEYATLRLLAIEHQPAVEAVGLVTGRGEGLEAVLITRYLDYSLPFHYLVGAEASAPLAAKLVDAGVVLLARLHLDGFYWGDCSLSNLLFRRDAGALMAYLVDAETASRHEAPLADGLRSSELEIAKENVVGGLLDLQASGRLREDVDVITFAESLEQRYVELWAELTGKLEIAVGDRHLIERRLRRINDLGFDVGELVVERDGDGARLSVRPALVEEGHHARELRHLTGLDVQENQARRLLNDIAAYGAFLSRQSGTAVPGAVAAARWIADVYEPVLASVPPELQSREPAELFHELLEHRWYLSEAAGRAVDNETALASYVDSVLRARPSERLLLDDDG